MKKLLTASFLLYASINFAQITLEHTYTTTVGVSQTGPSTWNYFTGDASNINVYDITHALVKNVPTPTISGCTFESIYYASNSLFDKSGNWAWEIMYRNSSNYEYLTTIYDQTGARLLKVDSSYGGYIFSTGSGTKMIINQYNRLGIYYAGNVYSLGGAIYTANPETGNENNNYALTNPYPNPSNDMIHLTYNLPAGTNSAEMVITNISGQVVKTCNVGNAFSDILLDTKPYAPGEYLYYIQSGSYTSSTSKFIISR